MKHYRFSLDDNILVFKDLAENNYFSIFENDYLALLKSVHDKFGTKIQLNIYYQTDGFVLSRMPDRYKPEWESVSDWLKLSFHAYSDDDRYADCSYDKMKHDCELVQNEILRFAGEKSLSYYTTLHYISCSKAGVDAMKDSGIKGLVGLFGTYEKPRAAYHLTTAVSDYMQENSFYQDEETGLVFIRNNLVLNEVDIEEIVPRLEKYEDTEFIEIMIHEQYFHPDYKWYTPGFEEKIYAAIKWLTAYGYNPAFFEEIFG